MVIGLHIYILVDSRSVEIADRGCRERREELYFVCRIISFEIHNLKRFEKD